MAYDTLLPPKAPRPTFTMDYEPNKQLNMPAEEFMSVADLLNAAGMNEKTKAVETINMGEETMVARPSSRAKHMQPGQPQSMPSTSNAAPTAMDFSETDIAPFTLDPSSVKRGGFVNQQKEALDVAMAEKDLSSGEKIAMALLSILPALVGGVGGGIAGGGYGAAAGLAGGLQGSAQGLQTMASAKKERRHEALSKAEDLQNRIDKIDTQLEAQQEKAQMRDFTTAEAEKERKNTERLLGQKQKFEKDMESVSHKHAMGRDVFQAKAAMDRARLAEQGDLQKAMLAAAHKEPKPPTEFEAKAGLFATDMLDSIPRLKGGDFDRASMSGAFLSKSDTLNAFRDPKLQQYAADVSTFLDAVARSRSGTGIRDDEWLSFYRQYFPLMGDSTATIELKRQKRDTAADAMLRAAGSAGDRVRDTLKQSGAPAAPKSLKDVLGF